MVRRAFTVALLLIPLAGSIGGCGANTVQVAVKDGTVQVERGEMLSVDLGKMNSSIGDSWYLVEKPDPAILSEGEQEYESDCDEPGCGGRLAWLFTARGPGTTALVFRYCYRSRPDNCEAQPNRGPEQPVTLTVTVT